MPARIAVNTAPLPQPPLMHATWGHDSRTHSAHMACKHAPSKSWGRAAGLPLEETRLAIKLNRCSVEPVPCTTTGPVA